MPLTTTLEDLRDAVQRTADVVAFTDKHPVSYINKLINRGLGALEMVCLNINPKFRPVASTTITADGSNTLFALPSNFRSLISVEYTDSNSRKTWLTPYEQHERAALTDSDTAQASTRANFYAVVGTNIELLPRPPEDDTALLWYATTVTQLASDAATMSTMDRLDSYVIWWAAREIANEREHWERSDRLTAQMGALVDDIRICARSIDVSHPSRIVDQTYADRYGRYSWRGRR